MLLKILLTLSLFSQNVLAIVALDPIGLHVPAILRGFLMGTQAAVNSLQNNVDNGNYTFNIKKNYQLIVPGYEIKPQFIWKGENIYDWSAGDWLIGNSSNTTGWIQQNGLLLRGHNLLWARDQSIPKWLIQQEASITPNKAKSLLSDYIHAVVSRYRGKIAWWDVVNEAIDDKNNTNPYNLRDNFWFRKLGVDFMKYAFIFAHEADPNTQLYYNDYAIEAVGAKSAHLLELVQWLRSQQVPINAIGMQWHIDVAKNVTPGDAHYQSAQNIIDAGLNFTVTELDISIPMKDGQPIRPEDIEKQGVIYRSILHYALHFYPRCPAMLTWGFTDRYSWIPDFWNHTRGEALPLDKNYQPKPAYWQMQEELARVLSDGTYRLSPQSLPNKCLGTSTQSTSTVQLYDECNQPNQKWNVTWLGDGTYRLSPLSANDRVLAAYNLTAPVGEVLTSEWSGDASQEWVLTMKDTNQYRFGPRGAWERVLGLYATNNIGIVDDTHSVNQQWILVNAN